MFCVGLCSSLIEWLEEKYTCSKVEHVEVRREVVSDVPSGQMVQICLMKKLPTIPGFTAEGSCHFFYFHVQLVYWSGQDILHNVVCEFILRVIENCCEGNKNSSRHTCKENQLPAEETFNKYNRLPPHRGIFGFICSRLCCAQDQSNGQGICDGVDVHNKSLYFLPLNVLINLPVYSQGQLALVLKVVMGLSIHTFICTC